MKVSSMKRAPIGKERYCGDFNLAQARQLPTKVLCMFCRKGSRSRDLTRAQKWFENHMLVCPKRREALGKRMMAK